MALFNTEADGILDVFTGGGGCFLCHPPADPDAKTSSVFTDFSYGDLGLTFAEEQKLVEFLETLTDE